MSRRDAAVTSEPTPTPVPASEARLKPASDARPDFRERFRAASAELVDRLDIAAHDEIDRQYGGDPDLELAAVKEGRHPLQRGGRDLDAHARYEAKLAAIRATLGR